MSKELQISDKSECEGHNKICIEQLGRKDVSNIEYEDAFDTDRKRPILVEYRAQWQAPEEARENHASNAHDESHKYVDSIIVEEADAAFNTPTVVAVFLILRANEQYLHRSH